MHHAVVATFEDVRRLALALPEVEEGASYSNLAWKVKGKAFVWERPLSKKDHAVLGEAAPDGTVLAACVQDEGAKTALLAAEPGNVFTTPHFDGYPIVLARLATTPPALLEELVTEAWLAKAPPKVAAAYLEQQG